MSIDPHSAVPSTRHKEKAMTTGWLIINIALAITVSAVVAGVAVLVPHRLHRHAMRHDPVYAHYHGAWVALAERPVSERRDTTQQRHRQAA
jgi:hypothetical protein